jgi:hypothetical protein
VCECTSIIHCCDCKSSVVVSVFVNFFMSHFHNAGPETLGRSYNSIAARTSTDEGEIFHGWSDITTGDVDETILCCSICLENYVASTASSAATRGRNPKLLNCLHTFCRNCVTEIAEAEGGTITCRKCNNLTNVNSLPGGVNGLRDDFTIQHLLEMMTDYTEV